MFGQVCMYVYTHTHTERERERERDTHTHTAFSMKQIRFSNIFNTGGARYSV